MKVLVIGGMHGNEPLGIGVVERLRARPLPGVDTLLANEQAIALNSRFAETDLNRAFPGNKRALQYEPRRATQVLEATAAYDLVLDFHNTHCPDNDCCFVGESAWPRLYDISVLFGLRRVIVADYDCLNKYAPNCLSIEISLDSPLCAIDIWYERIARLVQQPIKQSQTVPERYRFVYRMTLADRDRLRLDERGLTAFTPIPADVAEALGVTAPAYPIFIADAYTPYNYGGLLNKLEL